MPNLPPLPGARVIGERPQIQITDIRIIEPGSITFQKGGCDRPYGVMRAEIVDIPRGLLMMLPFDIKFAENLHKQLGDLITEHNDKRSGELWQGK